MSLTPIAEAWASRRPLGRLRAGRAGEGYGGIVTPEAVIDEPTRVQAAAMGDFNPVELDHGKRSCSDPPFLLALLPLLVVIVVNFLMALIVFPRLDFSFLEHERWGGTTIGAMAGVWSVVLALAAANLTVIVINYRCMPSLRESLDAGATSSALPILMISILVGFGAVIAALPAFSEVRDAVLSIQGGR